MEADIQTESSNIIHKVLLSVFAFTLLLLFLLLSTPAKDEEKEQNILLLKKIDSLEQELATIKQKAYNDSILLSDYQEVMLQVIQSNKKSSQLFLDKMDSLNTTK